GRRIELHAVVGEGTVVVLPPGESLALTATRGVVRFDAGASSYELDYVLEAPVTLPEPPATAAGGGAGAEGAPADVARLTEEFGVIALNEEQRLLLVSLCQFRLRDPAADRTAVPSNAEVANRLGWSIKKFDRKLDYLCAKLTEHGVRGLRGGKGIEATTRRMNLVEHAIRNRLVTFDDLGLLDTGTDSPGAAR
ncbi:MAG: hypothetical protein OEV40_29390, partial [Acidimicrobiia bacterium]|nr:hypothetical protein [Acidimicrobiia bacterium]